jgi:hypothetical protein
MLEKLMKALEKHVETSVLSVLRGCISALQSIQERCQKEPGFDLDQALENLEQETLAMGLNAMPSIDRVELEHGVKKALGSQPEMQPSIYAETRKAFTEKRVREYLQIPILGTKPGGGWS